MKKILAQIMSLVFGLGMPLILLIVRNNLKIRSIILWGVIPVVFCLSILIFLMKKHKKEKYISNVDIHTFSLEFENLYKKLYDECIKELEVLRKKVAIRMIIQYIVYALLLILIILGQLNVVIINSEAYEQLYGYAYLLCFVGVIFTLSNKKYKNNYKKAYKQKVISHFIRLIDNKLIYCDEIDNNLAKQKYDVANFDSKSYNRFEANDQINGSINNSLVNIWDLTVKKITSYGRKVNVELIFQGMFACLSCSNNIEGMVKITKNKISQSNNNVRLDSNSFEECFDVYAANNVLAHRILTHDIMTLFVDFYNKYNLGFEVVFDNYQVYLRFSTTDMFEPKVFGVSMKKELLYVEFTILKFILELTKKINEVQLNVE